jgi:hypothetical protein
MNTAYAGRFIGHLTNQNDYCASCGDLCITCRKRYELDFSEHIVQTIDVPALLPAMLDDPTEYLPASSGVADHDILVAVSVHEELLQSFIERFGTAMGVVIPIEEPWWLSPYGRSRIREHCAGRGIEVEFPKPFCSFNPEKGILKAFKERFRIGKPAIDYTVRHGRIVKTNVICSAPCGATYYVARNMEGRTVDRDLVNGIDALLSAYPCTASTEVDREFGDSIIHRAVQLQRDILRGLKLDATARIEL